MDSIMCIANIGNLFTLINVLAGDAVPSVAKWTPATLERAIREADAFCAWEAWVGQTTIYRDKDLMLLLFLSEIVDIFDVWSILNAYQ